MSSARAHRSVPPSLRLLVAGVVLSLLAAAGWQQWLVARTRGLVLEQASVFEAQISTRMESFLTLLRGAAGLFAASDGVTRDEFRSYTAPLDLARNYPGMLGVGFSRRVRAAELPEVRRRLAGEGLPDFRVWPETPREEYHAIVYIEPTNRRNLAALGYDMFTEPVRRAAMERAWQTGRGAMSGTVTLVQEIETEKQHGFLIYFPVYRRGAVGGQEALAGFVYSPFRIGDFLSLRLENLMNAGIAVAVFDHPQPARGTRVFGWAPRESVNEWTEVRIVRTLPLADRTWSIAYTARVQGTVSWWGVLAAGLLLTAGGVLVLRREESALARAARSVAVIRERESEVALLMRAMPGLIVYVDRGGRFRVFNGRLREWFGVEPEQLIGRTFQELARPAIAQELGPLFDRALAGEAASVERWFMPPVTSPSVRWTARYLAVHLVPHRTPTGESAGFYGVVSDLTSHKRAEESARFVADCSNLLLGNKNESEMLRGLVELAVPRMADAAAVVRVSATGENEQVARAGVGAVLMPAEWEGLAHAEHEGEVRVRLGGVAPAGAASGGSALHVPISVRGRLWAVLTLAMTESGRQFSSADLALGEEISTRVQLAVENARLFAEAKQEVEERRRAERAAQESREQLRLFVEGAADYAMFLMDSQRRITSWNHGAERILGFSEQEAVGMSADNIFGPEDRAAGVPLQEVEIAMREGTAPDERWHVRKDGTRFWASGHLVALRDESGLRGFAKIMRDLTGMKLTEEELERRVQQRTVELNEAVQELESFSYSVAHDLRSPLRSIQSFTQFAIEEAGPKLSAEERSYLDRVQRSAARLDRLISDLLAYSRVSKTRVELVPVDLDRLVEAIAREHAEFQLPRAEVQIEGVLGAVLANEAYLTQTITNLLGNAVKFVATDRRPVVRIWAKRTGRNLRLFVRDNGIGIAPEHQARIFDIFERLHGAGSYEGTGVGLAIVRRAVQRMNGAVGLESEPGRGTTFWLELPSAGPSERSAADELKSQE